MCVHFSCASALSPPQRRPVSPPFVLDFNMLQGGRHRWKVRSLSWFWMFVFVFWICTCALILLQFVFVFFVGSVFRICAKQVDGGTKGRRGLRTPIVFSSGEWILWTVLHVASVWLVASLNWKCLGMSM